MPNTFRDGLTRALDRMLGLAAIGWTAKDFGVTWDGSYGWITLGANRAPARYPGSDINWSEEVGQLWLNSVLSLCVQYVFDKIIEPRVHVVYEDDEGMLQPVDDHPCTNLLLRPNAEYQGNALLGGMALSYKCAGNAYAKIVRGNRGSGVPIELWYIPHWQIMPLETKDGGPTEFYVYNRPLPGGGYKKETYPVADVIHIRNHLDPEYPRLGYDQFRAQLRPLFTDNEIDTSQAVVLRNRGIPGAIVSPASADVEISADQIELFKRKLEQGTSGDNRSRPIVSNLPVKIERMALTPLELVSPETGERAVKRICSAFGIDPGAIGLASPGKGAQFGELKKQARESSYEQCILPLLAEMAEAFTYQLLPQFPIAKPTKTRSARWIRGRRWVKESSGLGSSQPLAGQRVNFDYSQVRDLQEDADAKVKRAVSAFGGNIVTLDEAREEIGLRAADDPDLGGKFAFQILPAPAGIVGAIVTDPEQVKIGDESQVPESDPDDEDLPEEDDEGGGER